MSRYARDYYSEPWMKAVLADAEKRLDSRRYQSDILPQMWDSADLGTFPPEGQEPAPIMFTPGFIVTIKWNDRKLVYHTDNRQSIKLVLDESSSSEADSED